LTRLFGFTQLDIPGTLPLAEGRYVLRDGETERVLVLQTLGAPPPPRRRRRKAREVEAGAAPSELPLSRATAVRAFEPFAGERAAAAWLEAVTASEDAPDALIAEALEALNRAVHAQTTVSGDPGARILGPSDASAARLGYGSGEQVAMGDFADARELDPHAGVSPKRRRQEELRPQERIAAVLGDRERIDPCEPLLLRARADLDAGRPREAALQLRVGVEALLAEFTDPPSDPDHDTDIAALQTRQPETRDLAQQALTSAPSPAQTSQLDDLLGIAERVVRRRRVLRA